MASQDLDAGTLGDRFGYLLQPIRDLAQNWSIDVASALEDYLEDLEGIQISIGEELRNVGSDDDVDFESVNFAQAALLIQGSALIYSKKVEYLYQLVHQTLDILSSQDSSKPSQSKAQSRQQANSALAEDEAAFREATANFLLLDHTIKEGKDIDLDAEFEYDPSLHGYGTRSAAAAMGNKALSPPSANPMLAALLKEDRSSAFRMNSCNVHASGALVIGSSLTGGAISKALDALVTHRHDSCSPPGVGDPNLITTSDSSPSLVRGQTSGDMPGTSNCHDDDDDDQGSFAGHDDYGGGGDAYDDEESISGGGCAGVNGQTVSTVDGVAEDYLDQGASLFGNLSPRKTRSASGAKPGVSSATESFGDVARRQMADPWAMLDPHDPTSAKRQPARKGKGGKVPPLVDPRSASARRAAFAAVAKRSNARATTPASEGEPLSSFESALFAMASASAAPARGPTASGRRPAPGVRQELDLSFGEFEHIAKRERQKTALAKRAERSRNKYYDLLSARSMAAASELEEEDDHGYDDFGGEGGGGVDFGVYGESGDDFDGNDNGSSDEAAAADRYGVNPNVMGQLSPFRHQGNAENDAEEGDGSFALALDAAFVAAPKSYAALCKQHIASFMKGVDRYAHESQLTRRVGEWQDKLLPVLEEQNTRREFDIHEYGQEILHAVTTAKSDIQRRNKVAVASKVPSASDVPYSDKAVGLANREDENRISFASATQSKPEYEAARLFLAMLQLTNNGNLALHHPSECTVCGPNELHVEVLSTSMAQERFDSYLAPSLVSSSGGSGPTRK